MTSGENPTRDAITRQMIAERAYKMWEDQGHPHGCDLIHWRQAEQEIMSCMETTTTASADAQAGAQIASKNAKSTASPTS